MMKGLNVAAVVKAAAVTITIAAAAPSACQNTLPQESPEYGSPRVLDGYVYAFDKRGDYLYVGGAFTTIKNPGGPQINQHSIFRFNMATRQIDGGWRPQLNGDVEGLALSPDGTSIYLGGTFTTVNGVNRDRLVKLSTNDASIDPTFNASVPNTIKDLALTDDAVIIGGYFRRINGVTAERLGAVNPTTGATLTGFDTDLTGSRDDFSPFVEDFALSPDGNWLVVGGNFTDAASEYREQIAVFAVDGATAALAPWSTTRFAYDCRPAYDARWIRGIAVSPDSKWFVVNTTGAYAGGPPKLCDTATRWELPVNGPLLNTSETWADYTGGDSLWEPVITNAAVFVGGHQRWHNNPRPSPGGDNDGPGSVVREGIAALDPASGVPLTWNPGRDRGRGVEAFLVTPDYLFVGSDTTYFKGELRQRVAILPYADGTPVQPPASVSLPVDPHYAIGQDLYKVSFDGTTFGTPDHVSGPGIDGEDWTTVRDGFVQNGQLVYFGPDSAYFRRSHDGSSFGSPTNLSATVGYVDVSHDNTPYDQPYDVAETRDAAFTNGKIFYTRTNNSQLWWRGYSVQSGIIGGIQKSASGVNWANARALDAIGNKLYIAWSNGVLYRADIQGGTVLGDPSSWTVVDNGASGIDWAGVTTMFSTNAG